MPVAHASRSVTSVCNVVVVMQRVLFCCGLANMLALHMVGVSMLKRKKACAEK